MVASDYHIGQELTGKITGIQSYGIFVQLGKKQQGLIHISEITNQFVDDIESRFHVGDTIRVKIIDIDEYTGRLSLSLRALNPVPIPKHPPRLRAPWRPKGAPIGFQTLGDALPGMMETALADIDKGKVADYRTEES